MEISRREFVLSAFTLSLISIYPKLLYACDISSVFDKMNPTTKIALGLVTVAAIYLVPQIVPVAIIAGAIAYTISQFPGSEDLGNILCSH
ncbi:hypothetical protein [Enterobacter ludwigii]